MEYADKHFRGKRIDNGEWVFGYFVKDPRGQCRIYWQPFNEATSNTYHFVKPETVGQYIRKGRVYEGDIVKFRGDDYDEYQTSVIQSRGIIDGDFGDYNTWLIDWAIDADYIFETIGNIHDNPELLESGS